MTSATLVWLESTAPGSAARTHLEGTRERMAAEGVKVVGEVTQAGEVRDGALGRIRRLARLVLAARRASRAESVLVARWHPFLAFVSPLWRRRGRGVVLLVQGNDHTTYETHPWFRKIPFSSRLMRNSLRASDRWLVLNEGLRDWLVDEIGIDSSRVEVLPTGVSDAFREARGTPSSRGRYVVFFGALASWQGVEVLLEATKCSSWPTDHRLIVIGDGPLGWAVEKAAAVGERVEWLGRRSTDETAAIVAGAACSVCPKLPLPSMANTTTPFKILESVAAGVPVVASDIPAQKRMIEREGYGLLARSGDGVDLATAINRLCTDAELHYELSSKAREAGDGLTWTAAAPVLAGAVHAVAERYG